MATGRTYEGATGYARDAKGELFLLAVTNMVGEDAFREPAGERTRGSPRSCDSSRWPTAVLADPARVAGSRHLPMRFRSAYRAASSLRWAPALERALQYSLASVPSLPGRTLVLVDRSGSMFGPLSTRTRLTRADAAAVFGTALASRSCACSTGSATSAVRTPPRPCGTTAATTAS